MENLFIDKEDLFVDWATLFNCTTYNSLTGEPLDVENKLSNIFLQKYFYFDDLSNYTQIEYDNLFTNLYDLIIKRLNISLPKKEYTSNVKLNNLCNDKKIIVGYSGGLDSTYQALRFKELGYDVTLLNIRGLNKMYPHEFTTITNFCNKYNFKCYYVDFPKFSSRKRPESIIRNMLILSYMIDLGQELGINEFAMGNFDNSQIDLCDELYCLSDSKEMYDAFIKDVLKIFPNFKYYSMNKTKYELYKYFVDNNAECLNYIESCVGPYRFRTNLHNTNSKKYGFNLLPNRDGSCNKCSMEYLCLSDLGYYPKNDDYIKKAIKTIANSRQFDSLFYSINEKDSVERVLNILGKRYE